jgi:hypothetical protein
LARKTRFYRLHQRAAFRVKQGSGLSIPSLPLADRGYDPDLNGGVLINATRAGWYPGERQELEQGKYEWSTMAKNENLRHLLRRHCTHDLPEVKHGKGCDFR